MAQGHGAEAVGHAEAGVAEAGRLAAVEGPDDVPLPQRVLPPRRGAVRHGGASSTMTIATGEKKGWRKSSAEGREVDAPHGKLMGLDRDSNHAMGDDPVLAVEEKYTRFRKDVTGSCILEKNMTWFLVGEWRGWDVLLFSHPIFILLRAHLFVMARHKKTN